MATRSGKAKSKSGRKAIPESAPESEREVLEGELIDALPSADAEAISPEEIIDAELIGEDDVSVPSSEVGDTPAGELVQYDPLQSYLAEIKNIPKLSREEEHELAVRFLTKGDKVAGYKLIMANLRLVVMIAREYQRRAQNILDLVQEGNIGLLAAIEQYDPYKGVRFPSYAAYWVRAYMLRYLINNLRLVKIGTTQAQRKLFFNLQKEREKLEREGFVPEARLLANRLNVKESEVVEMEQRLALPDMSVDAPVAGTDGTLDFHSILPDLSHNVEEQITEADFAARLREYVDEFKEGLDDKERAIVERRLFTEEPETLQDIADGFNLSRERIRQIETRLKGELKSYLSEKLQLGETGDISLDQDNSHT